MPRRRHFTRPGEIPKTVTPPDPPPVQVDLSKEKAIEDGRDWSKSPVPHRQCVGHRKNGQRCKNAAILGGTVCKFHGGNAMHVRKAARVRLEMAADRMAAALLGIATSAESEQVRLAAIKHVLSIGGISERTSVEVEHTLKPYEQILASFSGVGGTLAEFNAQQGLPSATAPAGYEYDEPKIIDAEIVDDAAETRADRNARYRKGSGRPPGSPEPAERRSGPITGEDALAEAARANREAGVWTVQRRRG